MNVGYHVLRRERSELAVVQNERVLDRSEHFEIPGCDVGLRHRPKVEQGPAVGCGEGLAWWDARRIYAFRHALSPEQECHFASIGTACPRPVVPRRDRDQGAAILALRPKNVGP